ncbi:MAG: 2-hydroxyacyl-CoA dehydratase family protein [bacterium]
MGSNIKSAVLEKLLKAAAGLANSSLQDFKDKGGKVIGYFCPFIPEELFIAGGFLPFRMRGTGSQNTNLADAYFDTLNCCFVRHTFNQLLAGKYSFLDGLVIGTGCDHLRRIFDNAKHAAHETDFIHLLDHPRTMGTPEMNGEPMTTYYRSQLAGLKEKMENHFNVEITAPRLKNAIKLCNETRRLQKRLYELRKADSPPINGMEIAAIMMAGASVPKEEYNENLKTLLGELEKAPASGRKYSARLMVVGVAIEDPCFYNVIEENGGIVVIDDLCFGARTVQGVVDEKTADPLQAIAKYQVLDVPFCPKINGAHVSRVSFIKEMTTQFKVDGVIAQGYVACDPWGTSFALLKESLKEAGIPFLRVDRDYLPSQSGQLSTRVQAFLETIGGRI